MATRRAALEPAVAEAITAALEAALLAAEPHLERAMKWRRPTYTVSEDWHHRICAIQQSRGAAHLWFLAEAVRKQRAMLR